MKFKTVKTELLLEGPAFKVERRFFEDEEGRKLDRDVVLHAGAVVIVPVTEDGKILMLKQYRHAISNYLFELPAGTLEPDEQPISCAEREVREETGYAAKEFTPLGLLLPAPGFCNELQHGYLATNLFESPLPQDEDEYIEVVPMEPEEITHKIQNSDIVDAKTICFFYRAILHGLLLRPRL